MTPRGQGKKFAWLQTDKGRAYLKRHNDRHGAAKQVRYRAKHGDDYRAKHAAEQRLWRATPHGKRMKRDWALRKAYGISLEEVEARIVAQGGVCPVCLEKLSSMGKGRGGAAVDHNHDTGKVRGILCQQCNAALGSLGDDPETLKRGYNYLKHK